jgi:hypothetical protein
MRNKTKKQVFLADAVDCIGVDGIVQQLLGILAHDDEAGLRYPRIIGNRGDIFRHQLQTHGAGEGRLSYVKCIDAIEINAIEAGGDDAVEIGAGIADDQALPLWVPVPHREVARPVRVFVAQPGWWRVCPVTPPV